MSKPKSYKIRTLQDIFALPTPDAMERCLDELKEVMISTRAVADDMKAAAKIIAKAYGKTLDDQSSAVEWPEVSTWTDDGGVCGSDIRFVAPDGTPVVELKFDKASGEKGGAS